MCPWSYVAVVLVALAAAACGDNLAPPPVDPLSCDADPDPRCEHLVDRVLIPRLRALEVPLVDAPGDELCRRLYLDLLDRGPTIAERSACLDGRVEDVVDQLLEDPAHERTWRARWSEVLGFDLYLVSNHDIVDLDSRVGAMERGELGYARFAGEVVMHPSFYALHPEGDWGAALYSVFLGRTARADEIAGLLPLTNVWQQRIYAEGSFWFSRYQAGLEDGLDDAAAIIFANKKASNGAKADWGINTCRCEPGERWLGCTSDTLGTTVTFAPRCVDPERSRADGNMRRTRDFSPGQSDECPDGTHRPDCRDRLCDFNSGYTTFAPWQLVDRVTRADLDGVGVALAARGDFWEAAADRELRWLLGWWQTTFRHPDSDLPEVRAVLAAELRAGTTPRQLRRLILTSLLYRLPATPPRVDELPPWATGPTKLLAGEGWLRAAAGAVGETVAPCDHRFVVRGGYNRSFVDPRLVDDEPSSFDQILDDPDAAIDASIGLGGCNADDLRPTVSNIGLLFTQGQLAPRLCAYGQGVVPPGWDHVDLGVAVDHLAAAVLSRRLDDDERVELIAEMQACMAADAGGTPACVDPEGAARWMCRRMLDSAEFVTY